MISCLDFFVLSLKLLDAAQTYLRPNSSRTIVRANTETIK